MDQTIAVIGQGYVGLPLSVHAAKTGYKVFGIDSNIDLVNKLIKGKSHINDVSDVELAKVISSGEYIPTNNLEVIKVSDIIIICVPTPLNEDRHPDLSHLNSAIDGVCKYLEYGSLIVIESTVAPGTVRNHILPRICKQTGYSEEEINLCFSPERVDPQNKSWSIENTPKLLSAIKDQDYLRAFNFYTKFVKEVVKCKSVEIAEMAKLLENSFRLINISFINEISIFCHKMGIDINEVIKAAATKPYGYMPFYPSLGVGGHCIPVDPVYLSEKAFEIGAPTHLINLASEINNKMPKYFAELATEMIGSLKGKRILILGVSYKPNISDVRETPVALLRQELIKQGGIVFWHDNLVKEWDGEKSVSIDSNFDLAILATPHDYLDLSNLGDVPVLNTRSSLK